MGKLVLLISIFLINPLSFSKLKDFDYYTKDPNKKISKHFKLDPYFYDSVRFWFDIYTNYDSNNLVVHDKNNFNLIYSIIDFTEISNSKLNRYKKENLKKAFVKEKSANLKDAFKKLGRGKSHFLEKDIFKALKRSHIKVPKAKHRKRFFFKELSKSLRIQTGQKNRIQSGLDRYSKYIKQLEHYVKLFRLPKELLYIPFLESSFNPNAHSKVGASGVWQFMRRVAKHFIIANNREDQRRNPILATFGALHLLKENKQILKYWDLAIPAYNSGTKHIIKARRKLKNKKMRLIQMLEEYNHPHIGFASKNFFSEFMALVYALNYKEKFYTIKKPSTKSYKVYLSKCSFKPNKIYRLVPSLKKLNKQFRFENRNYAKGTIIVSDKILTKRKYLLVTDKYIKRYRPVDWAKKLKKKLNCPSK